MLNTVFSIRNTEYSFGFRIKKIRGKNNPGLYWTAHNVQERRAMKTFRTLDLAIEYYNAIENIKLPYHLKDQLLRAASSVSLNLSEGNAKRSYADKKRIYQIALGSFRESQTILKLAKYENADLLLLADRLGACLYKLTIFEISARNSK